MTDTKTDMHLPEELTTLLSDIDAAILQTQLKLSANGGLDEWHKYQVAVFFLVVAKMDIDQEKLDFMADMFAAGGSPQSPPETAERMLEKLAGISRQEIH